MPPDRVLWLRKSCAVGLSKRPQRCYAAKTNEKKLAACITPHSGYHYDFSGRKFFEGWYFKVTLPGPGNAFAFIYSIEDPSGGTANSGNGAQVMGPDDSYLLQYSEDTSLFWAEESCLELGACFETKNKTGRNTTALKRLVPQEEFSSTVQYGYQASQTWHQGNLVACEGGSAGDLPSTVRTAKWAFSVHPVLGWGSRSETQKSTAGWLATLPVFEPHWQVTMALGKASGWIEWDGTRYDFTSAPAYAEKNWGGGFPEKWFWVQCDDFNTSDGQVVALTSVGARRGLLSLPVKEEVGLVGLHWGDEFLEFVPWTGKVSWEVEPWGTWQVTAENGEYSTLIEATCKRHGTPLRAPTADHGLSPLCRDSFFGQVRVRVWRKPSGSSLPESEPVLDVESSTAAVEIGGGPWLETWKAEARMKEPLRSLANIPVDVQSFSRRLPAALRPRGL